jgi:CheY-like chemotaxis protein
MPGIDGYETARLLRENPRNRTMPIVAMTAHAMLEERLRCLDAGMNDHIAKPIEVDKFFATVSRWLTASGQRDVSGMTDACPGGGLGAEGVLSPKPSVKEGALYLPGLETEKALVRLGNNERLYVKLLKQFMTFYNNTESQFYEAMDAGDPVTARRIAHTMKGLAGSIGASALAAESAFLEASFVDKNPDAIRGLAKNCFNDLAQVQFVLREAFAAEEEEPSRAFSSSGESDLSPEQKLARQELLTKLAEYLRDDDAEGAACFSKHARDLQSFLPSEAFSNLQGLISRFEFEEALEIVEEQLTE